LRQQDNFHVDLRRAARIENGEREKIMSNKAFFVVLAAIIFMSGVISEVAVKVTGVTV
jgi:hypothetical protein